MIIIILYIKKPEVVDWPVVPSTEAEFPRCTATEPLEEVSGRPLLPSDLDQAASHALKSTMDYGLKIQVS